MILNILMCLWFITYLAAIPYGIYQMYRNIHMTGREIGFFILGVAFAGIPFYWIMQHHLN